MYDAVLSLCERTVYQHSFEDAVPHPEGNAHPLLAPFGVFEAPDGHVTIGCVEDAFWKTFAQIIGPAGFEQDPRFTTKAARRTNRDELNARVNAWTHQRTKAELQELLGGQIPFGPVNTIEDIRRDPHTTARGMIQDVPNPNGTPWQVAASPVKFTKTPAPAPMAPPALDEDADNT